MICCKIIENFKDTHLSTFFKRVTFRKVRQGVVSEIRCNYLAYDYQKME